MKPPPLLLGAALLFWGWQAGSLVLAVLLAAILEGAGLVKSRWELSVSDFTRVADICALIFVGMTIFFLTTRKASTVIFVALQWFPAAYFPLVAAQIFSTRSGVDMRSLSLIFRKGDRNGDRPVVRIDLRYPYILLCILSAGIANVRSPAYFVGLLVLVGWGLWPFRSRRFSPAVWGLVLAAAWGLGWAGHVGLHRLQRFVQEQGIDWLLQLNADVDPFRNTTAIGDIGELKPSDAILFRVGDPEERGRRPPSLLREAGYNAYRNGSWFAWPTTFRPIARVRGGGTWRAGRTPDAPSAVRVEAPLSWGSGMLKLPGGTHEIRGLPDVALTRNDYGAVKAENGPGLITYEAWYGPGGPLDSPPDIHDLSVPHDEAPTLFGLAEDLGLPGRPAPEVLDRVARFFSRDFAYSLVLGDHGDAESPLTHFLCESRVGHCEYFATGTVLLLRAAGIPARYAFGYSVNEYSMLEKRYVVRERHAHSWALAHVDGRWIDVDNTPPVWIEMEDRNASRFEVLTDLLSWVSHRFSKWRWGEADGGGELILLLLIPLVVILGRRLKGGKAARRSIGGKEETAREHLPRPGADSAFYRIEVRLGELGYPRRPGEPLRSWIRRLDEDGPPDLGLTRIRPILRRHYRYRFDPRGLSKPERREMARQVDAWLADHPLGPAGTGHRSEERFSA